MNLKCIFLSEKNNLKDYILYESNSMIIWEKQIMGIIKKINGCHGWVEERDE